MDIYATITSDIFGLQEKMLKASIGINPFKENNKSMPFPNYTDEAMHALATYPDDSHDCKLQEKGFCGCTEVVCDHQCSGNCRRNGCNCNCGEYHEEKNENENEKGKEEDINLGLNAQEEAMAIDTLKHEEKETSNSLEEQPSIVDGYFK